MNESRQLNFEKDCDVMKITNEIIYDSNSEMTEEIIKPFFSFNISIYDPIYKNWTYNISNMNKNDLMSVQIRENLYENEKLVDSLNEPSSIRKALKWMAMPFSLIFTESLGQILLCFVLPMYFFILFTRMIICKNPENIANENQIKQDN